MRRLFADAFYWIALLHAGDQWHRRVIAFTETLSDHHLYTTDAVFDEYLAAYSARESYLRQRAAATVRRLLASPEYGERFAKQWIELARATDAPQAAETAKTSAASQGAAGSWTRNPIDDFIRRKLDAQRLTRLAGNRLPNVEHGDIDPVDTGEKKFGTLARIERAIAQRREAAARLRRPDRFVVGISCGRCERQCRQ